MVLLDRRRDVVAVVTGTWAERGGRPPVRSERCEYGVGRGTAVGKGTEGIAIYTWWCIIAGLEAGSS